MSTPLVFVGSFFGYKKDKITHPVRTNLIPRQIPMQPWYMHPVITAGFGGILPFGAVSVELFFIMSALWLHQIYYIFGFLFLVCCQTMPPSPGLSSLVPLPPSSFISCARPASPLSNLVPRYRRSW